MHIQKIPPPQLAARCQKTQADGSHESFCFELFRRAILEGCSVCWHYLYSCYYTLVRYWICRRASFEPDAVEDLVQDAFAAFWRFYTPEKLARANGLGDVLAYLKSCVTSAVAQAGRRAQRAPIEVEWDNQTVDGHAHDYSAEASASERISAQQIWTAVQTCCNDEQDHVVARLLLLAGLKPRQVAEQRPDLFPDVSDVYRIKRNLFDRLRRAPALKEMRENWQN